MPDYAKSKIYKIVCNITGETYYGSTTQTLSKRLAKHRTDAKNAIRKCTSKQIVDRNNCVIILCEECPCETKEQLHAIERRWIEENECVNKFIPGRTKNEYYATHKEEKKAYYEEKKAHILDWHKQYNIRNSEKHKQYCKERYYANRERILAEMREKYRETHIKS